MNKDTAASERSTLSYSERLYLPWWGWPVPLALGAALAATVHMGYPGLRAWLPYLIIIPAVIAVLVLLSTTRVRLHGTGADCELHVAKARLPVRYIGQVEVVPREAKRQALGPDLDPAAYLTHRGWIGPVLRVHLCDERDPTPYWLFSTRNPDTLATILRSVSTESTAAAHGPCGSAETDQRP